MTLDQAVEDHIKLAVRVQAGRPLRAHRHEPVTAQMLADELRAIEQTTEFEERERMDGFQEARYAVDALIDSVADSAFKAAWTRRNADAHVGHNFYTRLIAAHERGPAGRDVLKVYVLCALLGFTGDPHARLQDKVLRAMAEVVQPAPAIAVGWPPAPIDAAASPIAGSHRMFTAAAVLAAGVYLTWLTTLWGLRVAFEL